MCSAYSLFLFVYSIDKHTKLIVHYYCTKREEPCMFNFLNKPTEPEIPEETPDNRVELSTNMHWDGTPEGAYLLVPSSVNFDKSCVEAADLMTMPVLHMSTGAWVELGTVISNPKIKPAGVSEPSKRFGNHPWENPISSLDPCGTIQGHDALAAAVLQRKTAMAFHYTRGTSFLELSRLLLGFPAREYQDWLAWFVSKHAQYRESDIFTGDFYAHTNHELVPAGTSKLRSDWFIWDFNRAAARSGVAFVTIGDGHYSDNGIRAAPLYHDKFDKWAAFGNVPAFTICDYADGTFNGTDCDD